MFYHAAEKSLMAGDVIFRESIGRTDLPGGDFKTLVEAFGHVGIRVSEAMELDAAMEEAFSEKNKNRLVFVDVWVDPHEHVYPMAIKGGAMSDMILSKTQGAAS